MAEVSYIKNDSYTDMVKLENHTWYGLQKVFGKEFCKTGYFKPYWDKVKAGKFIHEVNGVIINIDRDKGIRIERIEEGSNVSSQVVSEPKKESSKVVSKEEKGTGSEEVKKTRVIQFQKVVESGKGDCCVVRFYHGEQNIGYLDTTEDMEEKETGKLGLELAQVLKISPLEIRISKDWYCSESQGKPGDYL